MEIKGDVLCLGCLPRQSSQKTGEVSDIATSDMIAWIGAGLFPVRKGRIQAPGKGPVSVPATGAQEGLIPG